jgi:signal transduction histidine kinase/FixJ family two-component response regulator
MFIYFSKQRIDNIENKLYKILIISNFIGLIVEILCYFFIRSIDETPFASNFVLRTYLFYLCFFIATFTDYIAVISYKSKYEDRDINKFFKNVFIATLIIVLLEIPFIYFLPMNIYNDNNIVAYTYGPAVYFVYLAAAISMMIWFFNMIINIKKLKDKKYLPLFVFLAIGAVATMIQFKYPAMLLMTSMETLVVSLMYHTIENPDVKMLRQMELAKDQAERANNAKSDFLSSMSHEIRTPLNAIVGFSEDIQSHKDTVAPEIVEDADYIMEASKTLLEIVGNILDINKIESNKMEITEVKYNFKEEIENLAKIDATRIGEKNINFKINLAPDIPYELIGDKTHIKEIVNNLLTNAIKYTEQGEIELSAKCINKDNISNLIISVRDTGKGIKAEHINRLFTKFDRLDVEKNTTTEGTGLGLAITKALVEMMGGKINVQSQFGKGSMFVVQIPQKISQMVNPDQTIQINIAPIKQAMSEAPVKEQSQINIPITTVEQNISSNFDGKKILIVDDNKLNIKVARRALQDFNFEIEECYDGQECLDKVVNGNEYDLILMDIMMPNMSGETAIAKLKEKPNFNIPTIALTADAVAGAKEKYIGEGFIDYIAKPFSKDQIKEKLDMVFNSSEPKQAEVKKDELEEALSDMSKPIQEIELPNQSDTTPKYDPNVDRFKDAATYVFDSTKKDDENQQ